MLVNLLIYVTAFVFSYYVIYSACRKYIGSNPQAPSLWARIKAWWPGFVKRHIVDEDPYRDESHAGARYADDYVDWTQVQNGYDWASAVFGVVCLWKYKPYESKEFEMFTSSIEIYKQADRSAIIWPLPPWRDSLRHRPDR